MTVHDEVAKYAERKIQLYSSKACKTDITIQSSTSHEPGTREPLATSNIQS